MRESRTRRRLAVDEKVNLLVHGEKSRAVVVDLSWGGVRLELETRLEVGSRVAISPCRSGLGRAKVPCAVRWTGGGQAGLEFLRPPSRLRRCWISKLLDEDSPERRATVRAAVELPVEARSGQAQLLGQTVDVSRGGALLRLPRKLSRGKEVRLFLCLPFSLVEAGGRVVESRGDLHAVRFTDLDPFQEDVLESFVEHALAAA